ncbi:MAG: WG repeat-containing protein [Bacteroidetes bacterium]|nr:WG repeat-containing protein [Bacteroidota bacterium]
MKKIILLFVILLQSKFVIIAQPTISLYPAQRYKLPYQFGILSERNKWNILSIRSLDAPFIVLGEQRSKFVFTDPNYYLLNETIYNYVGENINNRIPIGIYNEGKILFGFVSTTGSIVVPPIYYDVYPFADGRAEVMLGGKVGIINEEGKYILPLKYEYIGDFLNGIATAKYRGKYLLLSETGKELTEAIYDHIGKFDNNLAPVKKINLWGFIDRMGMEIIPVEYEFVTSFEYNGAVVGKNNKFGIITNEGILITELEYDSIGTFIDDWAEAKKNGKKLSLSRSGKEFTDFKNK